jgi:DNA-nicking Smr family endonuclease
MSIAASTKPPIRVDDEATAIVTNAPDDAASSHPYKPDSRVTRTHPLAEQMAEKLTAPDGAADYRRRQQIVEPVFAHIKHLRGITRMLRRGRVAVQAEIDLIATSHNLLKLYRAAPQAG